jgi:hypothetical protein
MMFGGPTGALVGAAAGGLYGYFGGKDQEKPLREQTIALTSAINTSNKYLQAMSRDTSKLVRLQENYLSISPLSQYFAESMGVENRFARERLAGLN